MSNKNLKKAVGEVIDILSNDDEAVEVEQAEDIIGILTNAIEADEEVIERPYTLRKLKDGDLILLLGLFRKLGLKDFKEVIVKAANGNNVREIGVEALLNVGEVVIMHLETDAGPAIYDFYADMSGLTVEQIKELEFGTLPMMIYDSFSEVKNSSFFKVLAKLP